MAFFSGNKSITKRKGGWFEKKGSGEMLDAIAAVVALVPHAPRRIAPGTSVASEKTLADRRSRLKTYLRGWAVTPAELDAIVLTLRYASEVAMHLIQEDVRDEPAVHVATHTIR